MWVGVQVCLWDPRVLMCVRRGRRMMQQHRRRWLDRTLSISIRLLLLLPLLLLSLPHVLIVTLLPHVLIVTLLPHVLIVA